MKKKVAILVAIMTIAAAVPALAYGGRYNANQNCVNNEACTRVCSECGGAISYGECTECGSDQRLYQNIGQNACNGQGQGMGRGHGCRR